MFTLHNRRKAVLLASASAVAILPVAIFAASNILKSNNTSALTYTIPSGYTTITDPVFYDCVVRALYSGDSSAANGPTDEQLAGMVTLLCDGSSLTDKIEDATGLEKMTNLMFLDLSDNNLSTIDVSKNIRLHELQLDHNNLSTIDVSKNIALEDLDLSDNNLSTIDVSKNTALEDLDLDSNNLSAIDVSKNTALEDLSVMDNNLSTIDVSKNIALNSLGLEYNNLSTIDLSNNTALEGVSLLGNAIFDFSPIKGLHLLWSTLAMQKATVVTHTSTYVLPPLFTQVRDVDWSVMYTDQPFALTNATISDDGKSITITDLTQPATIEVQGGAAGGSILTVNYVAQYNYKLSFDANGGTNAPGALTYGPTTDDSHEFTIPNTVPTRSGYIFLGWAENSSATSATIHAGDSITLSADKTLYAIWKSEPTPDPEPDPDPEPELDPDPEPEPDPDPEPEVLTPDTGFNTNDLNSNNVQSLIVIFGVLAIGILISAYVINRIMTRRKVFKS